MQLSQIEKPEEFCQQNFQLNGCQDPKSQKQHAKLGLKQHKNQLEASIPGQPQLSETKDFPQSLINFIDGQQKAIQGEMWPKYANRRNLFFKTIEKIVEYVISNKLCNSQLELLLKQCQQTECFLHKKAIGLKNLEQDEQQEWQRWWTEQMGIKPEFSIEQKIIYGLVGVAIYLKKASIEPNEHLRQFFGYMTQMLSLSEGQVVQKILKQNLKPQSPVAIVKKSADITEAISPDYSFLESASSQTIFSLNGYNDQLQSKILSVNKEIADYNPAHEFENQIQELEVSKTGEQTYDKILEELIKDLRASQTESESFQFVEQKAAWSFQIQDDLCKSLDQTFENALQRLEQGY